MTSPFKVEMSNVSLSCVLASISSEDGEPVRKVILYFSKIVNLGLTQLRVFCFVLFLKNTLCKALLDGEGSNVNSKIKVARTFPLSLKGWQYQMYG